MKKQLQKAGFTLIELIVVIAILGVLAGGAAVGYSGYVKKANKAADQQLVGSIERALDVGSYAFDIDNVLQLGGDGLKLPVGFVVLKADGSVEAASGAKKVTATNECVYKTYQQLVDEGYVGCVVDSIRAGKNAGTIKSDSQTIVCIVNSDATRAPNGGEVCVTHSQFEKLKPAYVVSAEEFNNVDTVQGYPGTFYPGAANEVIKGKNYVKIIYLSSDTYYDDWDDIKPAVITKDNHGCLSVTPDSAETLVAGEAKSYDKATGENANEIYNAMAAAFGDNWRSELTLKYDGWAEKGIGNELGTLYAGCSDVFNLIEELAAGYGGAERFAQQFNDAMKKIPEKISTKEEFTRCWNEISSKTEGSKPWDAKDGGNYGDNFEGTSEDDKLERRAANAAMTLMYNAGFTTWMQQQPVVHNDIANVGSTAEAHAKAILGWGDRVDYPDDTANDPYTLCSAAFTDSTSKLPVKDCMACKELYEKYVSSGACAANASAAYDTFQTIHDTGDEVMGHKDNGTINYFDYYKNYMTEFKNMYGKMQQEAADGSCIIIAVYRTGSGAMDYDVYPAAADPRKS